MPPALSLVVLSLDRPLRLHWLLGALGPETGMEVEVLESRHFGDLAAAVRTAGAPSVALLREDLVPAPGWLDRAREAAAAGALAQGAVRCDPAQEEVWHKTPDLEALEIAPPATWAPAVNVVGPRDVLAEAADGLPAPATTAAGGAALLLRAGGAVAAPELLAWSSPATPVPQRGAAAVVRRHPELRRELRGGVLTPGHARVLRRDPRDRSALATAARVPVRAARDARALGLALAEAARERTLVL